MDNKDWKEKSAIPRRPRNQSHRRGRRRHASDNTVGTESIHSESTYSRASMPRRYEDDDDAALTRDQLGFDSIKIKTRRRGRSSSNHHHRNGESSVSSSDRGHRITRSASGTRRRPSTHVQFEGSSPRSRSSHVSRRSDSSHVSRRSDSSHISRRSDSSHRSRRSDCSHMSGRSDCSSQLYASPRARSRSSVGVRHSSNGRSRSQGRSNMSEMRPRSHSNVSRQSMRSETSVDMSYVEPNVHHNAIMTSEIEGGPVIAEMKENELFARKAGVNYTREGGDFLTLVEEIDKQGDFDIDPMISRTYSSSQDGDLPPNGAFLEKRSNPKQLLSSDEDLANLRTVAGQLCMGWKDKDFIAPTLARRLRDFEFAQRKRRKKFGDKRPWGILGLYDHLSAVRMDVEWADEAAYNRANGEAYKAWFEFVDESQTGNNRPFFTYFVMILCTGFLIASFAANGWNIEPFSVNPMIGPNAATLVKMGAKDSLLIVEYNEVWRLISAMVLHAGMIHYCLNMLALWFIGSAVEHCHGTRASIVLFVAPAIGGTILSAIFLPNYISVGASGGIFGLVGACIADIVLNWGILFNDFVNEGENKNSHVIVVVVLVLDILVNCLVGLTPFVDNFTHLGGMIFGFLCGTSTMKRVNTEIFGDDESISWVAITKRKAIRYFGIILTAVGILIALAILLGGNGQTTPCKACKAFSCVSFPPWVDYADKWWYCDDCGAVSADARINPTTRLFDQLTIKCPGGSDYVMPLNDELSSEKAWLENNLPTFCRANCPDINQ